MTNPIFLIRHASPDWDMPDIPYHIPPGPPLTAIGRKEAFQLGLFLNQEGVSQLFSSPLERCSQTAEIAASCSRARVEIHTGLGELLPGESHDSILSRMWGVFEYAIKIGSLSERVGLVTHGGTISVLLRALGMDEDKLKQYSIFDHANPVPPAGAWRVEQSGTRQPWEFSLAFVPGGEQN
jgi:broad specificity phosphatase PhoE